MKINKGIFSLICAFLCAAVFISVGSVIYHESAPTFLNGSVADLGSEIPIESTVTGTFDSVYIIKESNGKIGIFNESGELMETVNVSIITLPLSERERLSGGIKVRSEKELYSLVENYTG